MCSCGKDIETTSHFFLHCPNYLHERQTLLNTIKEIDITILDLNDNELTNVLLYGKHSLENGSNTCILNATMKYITRSKRFDVPLL